LKLSDKQISFTTTICRFILILNDHGYGVVVGEAQRPEEMAKIYAERGIGTQNSNHIIKLAWDLLLYKNGIYLTDSKEYEFAGRIWKSMPQPEGYICCWGGDFKDKQGNPKPDGNHFSYEHLGYK